MTANIQGEIGSVVAVNGEKTKEKGKVWTEPSVRTRTEVQALKKEAVREGQQKKTTTQSGRKGQKK